MKKLMAVFAVVILVAFAAPAFAATNPFMDVPAGHWAYDAVAQLAARGVASGYPDGSYKGAQPATRYEMASMVARALATMDDKTSRQDVELLKKLVLEFKNELDALGVKVNNLDKRVAVLEDGVGGWKIRGIFRFDAKFSSSDEDNYQYNRNFNSNEFTKERFRLFLTKTIDENTYVYAQLRTGDNGAGGDGRGDMAHTRWSEIYVQTKLPWDIGLRVGRFTVDFEGAYGLYTDNDAWFGDTRTDGFLFTKSYGMLNATAAIGRNNALDYVDFWGDTNKGSTMTYALDLNFQPNAKFMVGATGYWGIEDADLADEGNINTYGFYAGYKFTPAIALKGIYYFQDLGEDVWGSGWGDSPKAWKAILDIKQDALKFTSLWIEYGHMDNSFYNYNTNPIYGIGGNSMAGITHNQPLNDQTSKFLFVKAAQKWTDKWGTFLRYARADFDTEDMDTATEFGIGVTYQYTPAIQFQLEYNQVDYGTNFPSYDARYASFFDGKESVIRFRTTVSF